MEVFNHLAELPVFHNAVITIGSFDGVHKGHQKIIERLRNLAEQYEGESIVITFHPHPRLVLYPEDPSLKLITTIDEKVRLLERYGVDKVVVIPFTKAFGEQSPDEYIRHFLIDKFQPRCIVIGYDHRFGKNRAGDIDYLRKYEAEFDFEIVEIAKEEVEDIAVSSTKVRQALEQGDVQTTTDFLNHPYTLSGTVVHGQHIGQSIGYPTANLDVIGASHKLIPPNGIYAVRVYHQEKSYQAMLYIGTRPVLKEHTNTTIEVHIFNFHKDIYGDRLRVEFVQYLRADKPLKDLKALQDQLGKDKQEALAVFKKKEQPTINLNSQETIPSVAIAILNYNGKAHLENYLPSVIATSYSNAKVYVIDNASTDDSLAFLKQQYPQIQLVELAENHGFARGYNEGLPFIEADYFVLLNSDVRVSKDWLEPLVRLMEQDNTVACCQPKVRSDIEVDYFEYAGAAGGYMDKLGYPFSRGRIMQYLEKDTGQYDTVEQVFWASGAAMLIRPKLWRELEGFDSDYFAHLEEIDLCWRLQRAGYKVMVEPQSVVYHYGGGTLNYDSPQKALLNFRNSLYTLLKNESAAKLRWLIPLRLLMDGLAAALFLVQGKWAHIRAIWKAHMQFYQHFSKFRQKRKYYDELIEKYGISSKPSLKGIYEGSIVWQYYMRGRKKFSQLFQ